MLTTENKIAFVFPGQGAQRAGMAQDFCNEFAVANAVFEEASELLALDMKALCFEENEKLHQTAYTQAAILTACIAMEKVVKEYGICPQVTAGLSLGEYCAIEAAGGMTFGEAVTAVRKRGILMEEEVPMGIGGMSAVIGADADRIEALLSEIPDLSIANYNCPGQIVMTGTKEALAQGTAVITEAMPARVIPLNVSGPFHSVLYTRAGEALAQELERIQWKPLRIPYVTNVTAEYVYDISQTKKLLQKQISASVRWQQSIEAMLHNGVDTFIEIGPGNTLSGFIKKIHRKAKIYNIQTIKDLEKLHESFKC